MKTATRQNKGFVQEAPNKGKLGFYMIPPDEARCFSRGPGSPARERMEAAMRGRGMAKLEFCNGLLTSTEIWVTKGQADEIRLATAGKDLPWSKQADIAFEIIRKHAKAETKQNE